MDTFFLAVSGLERFHLIWQLNGLISNFPLTVLQCVSIPCYPSSICRLIQMGRSHKTLPLREGKHHLFGWDPLTPLFVLAVDQSFPMSNLHALKRVHLEDTLSSTININIKQPSCGEELLMMSTRMFIYILLRGKANPYVCTLWTILLHTTGPSSLGVFSWDGN